MRDLRVILSWLRDECRTLLGFIREPNLWIALACALILWTLAYQVPYSYRLDLGGSLQTGRRYDDKPFLGNFNESEPEDPIPEGTELLLRWSKDDSTIVLPGIGGGRWLARVRAGSGPRPDLISRWDDGATVYAIPVNARQRDYYLVANADSAGDLKLHFVTPPLTPAGDPRTLGLVMTRVVVEPTGGVRVPAPGQLALLAIALALVYTLLRRLALAPRAALIAALSLAALVALLLARERMALTLLTPILPALLFGCYALGILLDALYRAIPGLPAIGATHPLAIEGATTAIDRAPVLSIVAGRASPLLLRPPALARPNTWLAAQHPPLVIGLIVLAAALRLGGILHPHAILSDDGLNANDLIGLTTGSVYFTEGLTWEAGGGQAPYPPAQYIVFAPAQILVQTMPNDLTALRLLLRVGNALWDSMVVGVVWYMLRSGGSRQRAALLGAALYLLPPPLLKSLSVGEFANIFGQALALPVLALLATRARGLQQKPFSIVLIVLLALALLGHLGVTISLFCLLACLVLVWLIRLETRQALSVLLVAGLLAGALVALFYYTALWDVLLDLLSSPKPAANADAALSISQKLTRQAGYLQAYGIQALLLATSLIGMVLVALRPPRRRGPAPRSALGSLLIAWWGGTLLSLGLLLYANQAVRWYLFIYPALCLGAGPTLASLWPRGRAGRLVSAVLLGFLLWYGLWFWVTQIVDYKH